MKLCFQTSGREKVLTLKSSANQRSIGPETFKWDLASLALAPGERVSYRLEAGDNDSVSGPKFSSSRTLHLYVRDERSRAAKEGEEAQQLADALLDLLADQLEELKEPDFFRERMEEILERLDQKLTQRESRPDRFDLEALKKNLTSLKNRLAEEPKENVTHEMERLALLAEDMAKKARMNELEAMARELKNRQRRLLDSLNDLKNRFDQKELEAILKELKQLEELLRQVMDAMSKLAQPPPRGIRQQPGPPGDGFSGPIQGFGGDPQEVDGRGPGRRLGSSPAPHARPGADDGLNGESGLAGEHGRHGPDAGGDEPAGGRTRQDPRGAAGDP